MKRTVLFLIALTVLVVSAPAFAATATAPLSISASVSANCTITTSPVAFGAYDPLVANAAAPKDATGAVNVACTRGASGLRIDLSLGANALGSVRRMLSGVANFMTYELYTDAARTTVWGSGAGTGGLAIADAPSLAVRAFTVFGRVPAAQDVAIGAYADTVTATINF